MAIIIIYTTSDSFVPGTFGSVVVISGVREKGLLGGGQACFSTSYRAQDGPHLTQQRVICPKMSVVPRVEKL